MSRLRAVAAVLSLGVPMAASAADITRVASSFEDADPFGLFIDAGVEYAQRNAKVLREVAPTATTPEPGLVHELNYAQYETRLNVDVAAGISRDVEFTFGLPVVLFRNEFWRYPDGRGSSNSSIATQGLFTVPLEAYRRGLGNARFGLAWAIFNQQKDDTKPTWVARINYEAPTAGVLDPSIDTRRDGQPPTPVGDRVHKYTLSTALSRRIGIAEPYFRVAYTVPVRGPGAYSNCDARSASKTDPNSGPDTSAGLGTPQNCGQYGWSRGETGIQAPHVASVTMGTELQVGDRSARMLKLDVRALGNFVSAGRYYNELSGAMRKLLFSTEYLQLGGQLGVTFQLNEYISFRGTGHFLYNTDHALTAESVGRDTNGDGKADFDDVVNSPNDRNPNFDYRTDLPTRRFYASESRDLRVDATVTFQF